MKQKKDRVQLAVLKNAAGSIDELLIQIQTAKLDYRDVLAWAEYPSYRWGEKDEAEPDRGTQQLQALQFWRLWIDGVDFISWPRLRGWLNPHCPLSRVIGHDCRKRRRACNNGPSLGPWLKIAIGQDGANAPIICQAARFRREPHERVGCGRVRS